MNNEFKKISKDDTTRYVLESASGGGTGAGSIATAPKSMGGVQRRSNLLVQDVGPKLTPRSPVAHAAQKVAKGSGRHTDRKQQSKQVRGEKHKTKDFAENQDHEISMAGSELHSIFQNAKQLHTMIKTKSEEEGLDAWQQSKITKAADYLNSVLQSLQHEMMGEAHSPAQQAAIAIAKKKKKGVAEGSDQKKPLKTHKSGCGYNYGHDCDCGGTLTHASDCHYNYGHDCDCGLDKLKQQKQNNKKQGVAENATTGLQSDGKYYNKAGRLVGKWNGRTLILDPEFEQYHRDEGGFGDEEIEQMRGTFQHRIQKLTAPSEDRIKYVANELEKSDIQAGRPRQSRHEYYELAVQMLSDQQGVAEGGPFSYGKPPRKGSVADLAAKHRKEQDRKTPPIEPKDQMVGNAKVTKDTKEGLKQMLRKVDPTIKSRLRSKADRLDDEGDEVHQDLKSMGMEPHDAMTRNMDPEKYYRNADRYRRLADKDVDETQLDELDRPSGKLFIIVKADNAGATHVFGDFGSFPQDVMHKVSKRGTRDKLGAKTKLKIDFLFDNFRSTIQQLRTIFRDVDFVGAEAAEFIIHSSALRSDQGEDVKHLRDYIEAGDDRRMKMYQKPEDDEEDDGETTGGNMLRIDPETGAARKVVGVKPQTQMGGKSAEQPGMTTYRFKDPRFAQHLRGMNLGFNIKGDSITVDQKQKAKLVSMLGNKFGDIFTSQERFKEDDINELRDMGDKPTDGELLLLMRKYRMAKVKGQDPYSVMRREEMFKLLDNEDRVKELKHRTTIENTLSEKAVSQQQQKFFGMVHAMQKGKKIPGASAELKKTAKSMSKGDAKDFAKTRHAGLPKKISEFKGSLPPDGLTPDEAKKFAADQQARLQALYKQPSQTTGADRDLGNGFTLTTVEYEGETAPAILDTEGKIYWINPANKFPNRMQYGAFGTHQKIQNGKLVNSSPGPQTVEAMKAAGWTMPAPAPQDPEKIARIQQKQQFDAEYDKWFNTRPVNSEGRPMPHSLDVAIVQRILQGEDPNELILGKSSKGAFGSDPSKYRALAKQWLDWKSKEPKNPNDVYKNQDALEDAYMESLSAALEQKLSVNDTPEVWRDDFEHADPVKYPQFRNKTVEKKHRMADVARYRQIQKK